MAEGEGRRDETRRDQTCWESTRGGVRVVRVRVVRVRVCPPPFPLSAAPSPFEATGTRRTRGAAGGVSKVNGRRSPITSSSRSRSVDHRLLVGLVKRGPVASPTTTTATTTTATTTATTTHGHHSQSPATAHSRGRSNDFECSHRLILNQRKTHVWSFFCPSVVCRRVPVLAAPFRRTIQYCNPWPVTGIIVVHSRPARRTSHTNGLRVVSISCLRSG